MHTIAVIPARLASSRLPEKVIRILAGKPLVQHVFEKAKEAQLIDAVFIATDNEKVEKVVKGFTENVIMTSPDHASGTDRIAEVIQKFTCINVLNVQGDEPLIDPHLLDELVAALNASGTEMVSAMTPFSESENVQNPNMVKVVTDRENNALYFSRAPIPYDRDASGDGQYFRHLGVYGYKRDTLLKLCRLETVMPEKTEKLEQLRALYHGIKIKMIPTNYAGIGIDTEEDLKNLENILNNGN